MRRTAITVGAEGAPDHAATTPTRVPDGSASRTFSPIKRSIGQTERGEKAGRCPGAPPLASGTAPCVTAATAARVSDDGRGELPVLSLALPSPRSAPGLTLEWALGTFTVVISASDEVECRVGTPSVTSAGPVMLAPGDASEGSLASTLSVQLLLPSAHLPPSARPNDAVASCTAPRGDSGPLWDLPRRAVASGSEDG